MSIISLDKISDGKSQDFKIRLAGELLEKFQAYQEAYENAYQQKPEVNDLLCHLLEFAFHKDSKFKKWYATRDRAN